MVDLAQTIEEWKDLQSVKVDDQVRKQLCFFSVVPLNIFLTAQWRRQRDNALSVDCSDQVGLVSYYYVYHKGLFKQPICRAHTCVAFIHSMLRLKCSYTELPQRGLCSPHTCMEQFFWNGPRQPLILSLVCQQTKFRRERFYHGQHGHKRQWRRNRWLEMSQRRYQSP